MTSSPPAQLILDRAAPDDQGLLDVRAGMNQVAGAGIKSRWRQLVEIFILTGSGQRISPGDYYRFQLYDDRKYCFAEKRRFIGNNRYWELTLRVNDSRLAELVDDKLKTARLLARHGLPHPKLRAILHPDETFSSAVSLQSRRDLEHYLRTTRDYPLFGKPTSEFESRGATLLKGYDAARDEMSINHGLVVGVEAFAAAIEEFTHRKRDAPGPFDPHRGYLFFDAVRQHRNLAALCGETVASVRVIVACQKEGPNIIGAFWKIPAPWHIADNPWRRGNLVAALDPLTGKVGRVLRGQGPEMEEFEHNPHTGEKLTGTRLPHFAALREVVLKGSASVEGIRYQGWDVAITDEGPTVLEINSGSSSRIQLLSAKGLMTDEFQAFLKWAESVNPTRPDSIFLHPAIHGHRTGRLRGAWGFFRDLVRS